MTKLDRFLAFSFSSSTSYALAAFAALSIMPGCTSGGSSPHSTPDGQHGENGNGNGDGNNGGTNEPASAYVASGKIVDTQGNRFLPVPLPTVNDYAYRVTGPLEPKEVLPLPNSTAGFGPTGGALLLFKLKNETLANRPLVLNIAPPEGGATGHVDLDV